MSTSTRPAPTQRATRTDRPSASDVLERPVTTYYLLLASTVALVVIGLVMVLSASSITAYRKDGSAYGIFLGQARFAVIGLVAAFVASRIPAHWWRRLAIPVLVSALALQMLVFSGLGYAVNGNKNWIKVGSMTMQPSELIKLGLVLVGALILANKRRLLGHAKHALVPYVVPVAGVSIALVLLGNDLGTAMVMCGIVAAVMYIAGVPGRLFLMAGAAVVAIVLALVMTSSNRMSRITNWLSGSCTDPDGVCGQSVHGLFALADGGWWGVGLGASKEKWAWLAEAHNDFIFAIIGEELGLPGTLVILSLVGLLGYACFRLVIRSEDQFVRIASGGIMAWIMLQSIINIGAVVGLLPVIGVPLPLVSAGGSSLVTTLLALGIMLSFARAEPGASEWLRSRRSLVRSSLAVLPHRRASRTRSP